MNTQDAIKHFGSIKKVAEVLNITRVQSVYQWGDKVPMRRQYQLQLLTKGKLKADPEQSATSSAA